MYLNPISGKQYLCTILTSSNALYVTVLNNMAKNSPFCPLFGCLTTVATNYAWPFYRTNQRY
jgi:hypothetical protein